MLIPSPAAPVHNTLDDDNNHDDDDGDNNNHDDDNDNNQDDDDDDCHVPHQCQSILAWVSIEMTKQKF